MEASALYHQPQSEYAYLMTDGNVHIRLRSKRDDVARVILVYQDPYLLMKGRDFVQVTMDLVATSQVHDYYQAHMRWQPDAWFIILSWRITRARPIVLVNLGCFMRMVPGLSCQVEVPCLIN